MKFTVNSKKLAATVAKSASVVPTKPLTPILENLLFNLEEELNITGSDLSTSITTTLEVDVIETGSACIPAKLLADTLKALPEQPITITVDDTKATIKSSTGTFKMSVEPSEDFPKQDTADGESFTVFTVDTLQLTSNLDKTIFSTSNDDLRPSMTGVLFEIRPDHINLVSTDGHRLSTSTFAVNAFEGEVVVPAKGLNQIKNILTDSVTTVTIGSNYVTFFSGSEVTLRLIDEKFPDYRNVLPSDNNIKVGFNRNALLSSLKRVGLFSNSQTGSINFRFSNQELTIKADDGTIGNKATETIQVENESVTDLVIGFNHKYLTEIVSRVDSEEFTMTFKESMTAAMIENGSSEFLIMPVMINEEVTV